MANYYCAKPADTPDNFGNFACKEWVEVPQSQPSLLPNLTYEEANDLGMGIIFALVSAYGWKQLQRVF